MLEELGSEDGMSQSEFDLVNYQGSAHKSLQGERGAGRAESTSPTGIQTETRGEDERLGGNGRCSRAHSATVAGS